MYYTHGSDSTRALSSKTKGLSLFMRHTGYWLLYNGSGVVITVGEVGGSGAAEVEWAKWLDSV